MSFTSRQFAIRAKGSCHNKCAYLTVNFPEEDFTVLVDGALIQTKIEKGAIIYELLDPSDVVLELVVRSKSVCGKRSGVDSLPVAAPKDGREPTTRSVVRDRDVAIGPANANTQKTAAQEEEEFISEFNDLASAKALGGNQFQEKALRRVQYPFPKRKETLHKSNTDGERTRDKLSTEHVAQRIRERKKDANTKRMPILPTRFHAPVVGEGDVSNQRQPALPANLCKCPKNLHVLWNEYESGVGGNKPARLFTASERGKVRFKYSRRKIIWDTVEGLVRRGFTSDEAIDLIYSECGGDMKVNRVMSKIKEFRKYGNAVLHIPRQEETQHRPSFDPY